MQSSYQLAIDRKSADGAETQRHYYVIMLPAGEEQIRQLALRHLAELYPEDQFAVQSCKQVRTRSGLSKSFLQRLA